MHLLPPKPCPITFVHLLDIVLTINWINPKLDFSIISVCTVQRAAGDGDEEGKSCFPYQHEMFSIKGQILRSGQTGLV